MSERFVEQKGRDVHPPPCFSSLSFPTAHPQVLCLGLTLSPPRTGPGLRPPVPGPSSAAGQLPSSVLPVTPLSLDPHALPKPVSVRLCNVSGLLLFSQDLS